MPDFDLEQFSAYPQQLNFNLPFTDAPGWNHPPSMNAHRGLIGK